MKKMYSFRLDSKLVSRLDHLAVHKEITRTEILERAFELYWHDYKFDLDHKF